MKRHLALVALAGLLVAPWPPCLPVLNSVAFHAIAQPTSEVPPPHSWYFETLEAIRQGFGSPTLVEHQAHLLTMMKDGRTSEDVALAAELFAILATDEHVPSLATLLDSEDEYRVLAAIDVLSFIPGDNATTALLHALESDDPVVMINAMDRLAFRPDPRIAHALGVVVEGLHVPLRIPALDALGEMRDETAADTLRHLSVEGEAVAAWQRSIVRAADSTSDRVLRETLVSILGAPSSQAVRVAAFRKLSASGVPQAYNAMIEAFRSAGSPLRDAALQSIARDHFPDRTRDIASQLDQLDTATKVAVITALGQRGDPVASPFVATYFEDSNETIRNTALVSAGNIAGTEAIVPLIRIAAVRNDATRAAAMSSLVSASGDLFEQELLRQLAHVELGPAFQAVLAEVAGRRRLNGAVPNLIAMAEDGMTAGSTAAIDALREIADPNAVEPLARLVATASTSALRRRAADALGASAIAADRDIAAHIITSAIQGASPEAREDLLSVLGELGSPSTLSLFKDAAASDEEGLRRAAIRAMGRWPDAAPAEVLAEIASGEPEAPIGRLAARSLINLAQNQEDINKRWTLIEQASSLPLERAERLLLIAAVREMMSSAALDWLVARLEDEATLLEVQSAIASIALEIAAGEREKAESALLTADSAGESSAIKEALAQLAPPLSDDHHILVWDLAGPYRVPQGIDAAAFTHAFPPEIDGGGNWRMIKGGKNPERPWLVDLAGPLGGVQQDGVAYLRTWFRLPRESAAMLEVASNAGLVIWLNGNEIHRSDAVRPINPANDHVVAPFIFGTNEMLVKVASSEAGSGFGLRVTEMSGQSLASLMVKGDGDFMMDLPTPPATMEMPVEEEPPPVWSTERWEGDPFFGDYEITEEADRLVRAAQVIPLGGDQFRIQLLHAFDTRDAIVATLEGSPEGDTLVARGDGWEGIVQDKMLIARSDAGDHLRFAHVKRQSITLGSPPPPEAIVLFDGSNFDAWMGEADGNVTWTITADGTAQVTPQTGGIITRENFEDFQLHLEFRAPYSPGNAHQFNGNSGVFLQMAYEIQVLANYGSAGEINECGAFYNLFPPDVNMCYPPLSWQTYDVLFQAARFDDDGNMTRPAMAVVLHNGVLIHEMRELHETSIPEVPPPSGPRPLYLQDHHNQVQYRNIWIQPLNDTGD